VLYGLAKRHRFSQTMEGIWELEFQIVLVIVNLSLMYQAQICLLGTALMFSLQLSTCCHMLFHMEMELRHVCFLKSSF
jgi:hypothetical protein